MHQNPEKSYVTYEDFGAIGDGCHDDMEAIVACHDYANAHRLEVRASDTATYYIGGRALTAKIQTSTHWGKAHFVIDDVALENIHTSCFAAVPDTDRFSVPITKLRAGQKQLDLPYSEDLYIRVYDATHPIYIRKGLNQNAGTPQSDAFVRLADGRIIGDINWDYDTVTEAYAFYTGNAPIVIEGGIFTTIANQAPSFYNYHARNVSIRRSHVTLRDITHYVTGELDHGAPYNAFLAVHEAYDVTIENCLLTPHKTYYTASKIPGEDVPMGSYDLSLHAAIGTRLCGIRQTIDIEDNRYWGLMGSNFSKEFYMENCTVSRFDAHMGVTNGVIRDCTLGHMGVNLIGFGSFTVENTTVYASRFINFRTDYGAFFHGTLTVRNCTWIPRNCGKLPAVFFCRNEGDHDFGYPCALPEAIVLDGLTVKDSELPIDRAIYLFTPYDKPPVADRLYPYGTTKHIKANVNTESGRTVVLCKEPSLFPHLSNVKIGD